MDRINIDQDTLAAFKNDSAGSGAGTSAGSQDSQSFDERATAALKGIDKSLKWLINSGDKKMKSAGGDGIGDETFREDYHELWMINIEDWARTMENDELLKKSPKLMLGIVTAGIIFPNMYDIYQGSKAAPAAELEEEKTEEASD